MAEYDRIETETETHRLEKAVRSLVEGARLPLGRGHVELSPVDGVHETPGGQLLLTLIVHLLARMKGLVSHISIVGATEAPRMEGVPLPGRKLIEGLNRLVESLSGPASEYTTQFRLGRSAQEPDVRLALGSRTSGPVDLLLGSDAWRALLGSHARDSRWTDRCPLGPYLSACLAASEVFKRLLRINFGWSEGEFLSDLAFSLLNYEDGETAQVGPDISELILSDLAVAGAGAGGTASLYTLASFPQLAGQLTVVEPGNLKISNLGRYLMSDYQQVHDGVSKLSSVQSFLSSFAPDLTVGPHVRYARGSVGCADLES
ncbi:MAG: hypothetical protein E6J43_10330 [Chloroflexi bacterium]|nr:MAG: hypothetical protein E6J43_10330 [Chloroflexota bacterium]